MKALARKKIFTGIISASCISMLFAAFGNSKPLYGPSPLAVQQAVPAAPPAPTGPTGSTGATGATGDVKLRYPMKDRDGDFVTDQPNDPFYLKDPPAIEENVEYDPGTGMYVLTEKVAGQDVRAPQYMSYEEYLKYTEEKERKQYWKERSNAINLIEDRSIIPTITPKGNFAKQLFQKIGGGEPKIEIRPQGNVEMTLGANVQKTANPNIPIRNRKTGGFDFDMNININVIGKIGDKLQLGVKYNTQSGFDFDNQIKLGYTGDEDDIIKVIELGNVSLPLPTRLISGSQTLFGVKTQLQFGRLTWTSVISQQKAKKETIVIEQGSQLQTFEIRSDQYEENKHFFLAQYFRDQYDNSLANLPNLSTVVNITRIEVWITNRNGSTQNVRDVVGFMDLGEDSVYKNPLNPNNIVSTAAGDKRPRNGANSLYTTLLSNPSYRFVDNTVASLTGPVFNLTQGQEFEKTYARKLNETEYTLNRQLGYISLNAQLNPNEVLAVAFQYQYNGDVFQVGEFGNQVPPDSNSTSKVLYLKLLKGTTVRPGLPIWHLMMKNIYSLGAYNVSNDNFRLDVYYNDPGGGLKRYIPKGCLEGKPLIRLLNLDDLNMNNDPQPDGLFDFIPGTTIITQNGRLIFPVKEPFGDNLRAQFNNYQCPQLASNYVYDQLYDSTKFIAQQFPEYNRFVIKGQYKGTNNREISLGAGNIPKGSVIVTAGGQKLTEGVQYTVDYNLGRVTIIDAGILNSGQQIKVDYENNNLFATQVRTMIGTRLDYRVSSKFNIGATIMQLSERPYTQKVNIGDDPIRNTIMGFDLKYETNMPWLTKGLDKLPFYSTKEMSTISTYAEFAYLKPGHSRAINNGQKQGQVYIDDFEGTTSGYDLRTPPINWKLASTPRSSPGPNGQDLFPEALRVNQDIYGYNRAKIAWYRIDNSFFNDLTAPTAVKADRFNYENHYVRLVRTQDVFPNRPNTSLDQNLYTFDVAYYPNDRGPYNYEYRNGPDPTLPGKTYGINNNGSLKNPEGRWGGIMRSIDNNDLEATNVEFIEFWLLDPFLYNTTGSGGKLYFNLGNISEDILRDSRMSFENGITTNNGSMDSTHWGRVPKLPPLVDGFDNDPNLRPIQDVGFDELPDAEEQVRKAAFLANVQGTVNAAEYTKLFNDPSSDNYRYFRDEDIYGSVGNILTRYKDFCGVEGNSNVQTDAVQTTAQTNLPDKEDLNRDNTLNENEEYFQYVVDLRPGMDVGNNPYIVSKVENTASDNNGVPNRWFQFRIPIREYTSRVGSIPDFKSIQFMRMFLNDWNDSVVLRFGTLQLVRNQWRTYRLPLDEPCEEQGTENDPPFLNVASVSIEENSAKKPVNYVLPPNIEREQAIGQQTNQFVQQNEQALSMTVCNLKDCKTRAVFKNVSLDVRRYKTMKMYLHANRVDGALPVHDDEVAAFMRVGSDFKDNYYQYEIPLKVTADGIYDNNVTSDREAVWPDSNSMEIALQDFVNLKITRNNTTGYPHNVPFVGTDSKGRKISIVGNPDIGAIKTIMLGIRNPSVSDPNNPLPDGDDGQPKCIEVWFNELRVSEFDEKGGVAALGSVAIKMADLGTVNLAGQMHTAGYGQVEQKIDQRYRDNLYQYDFSTNIEVGKLLPEKAGVRIPFYAAYSQQFSTPQYDPYQFDIKSKEIVKSIRAVEGNSEARKYLSQIQTINTRRGYNFSNVRFVPQTKAKRPHIYDPGNWNFTYSYNEILYSDPFTEKNSRKNWLGIIGWSFAPQTKDYAPLKKLIKAKTKWLDIIKDFSFNPFPSTLAFTSQWSRDLTEIKLRPLGDDEFDIPATYSKNFRWDRTYTFKYNPFKSLSIDYNATNNSRVDEPDGLIDTKAEKQTIWDNVLKGGRNTNFNQQLSVNYNIPINKLPVFDFITATVGYNSTYTWTALPWQLDSATGLLRQNSLGNILNNSQNDRVKVDLNMKKLYDKIPFLKTYDSPNPTAGARKETLKKKEAIAKAREKIQADIDKLKDKRVKLKEDLLKTRNDAAMDPAKREAEIKRLKKELKNNRITLRQKRKDLANKQYPPEIPISVFLRPIMALKRVTFEYKETKSTTLPGFTGYSQLFGNQISDRGFSTNKDIRNAPGFDFGFGMQPGDRFFKGIDTNARRNWLDEAAAKGWISKDPLLNQQFTQNRSQRLDINATLEPWPDLKIDLNLFQDRTFNHSEFAKYIDDGTGNLVFSHLNPMDMGSYSISYIPVRTFFKPLDKAGYSETYNTFVANREIISKRLGVENPNVTGGVPWVNPSTGEANNAYAEGYGPKSQDVLIPAFLAAYTKTDANKITLNPFKSVPLPNWRISYNGITKFKWAQKIFTNFTITHGYSSTMVLNSFQTNLDYKGNGGYTGSSQIDSLSGNFTTLYNMPSVVVNEQFSPLIGVDMAFKNNVTARFDYKKSRTMTVSFADFQMIEMNSSQYTVSAGYKITGLKLPIKIKGKKIRLNNDLNFKFEFSYRDNVTVNHRIDVAEPQITQGSTTITIQPSIDYIISKQLNIRIFFDQTRTIPKISTGFPTTNTRGGITLRFSLSQ